MFDITILSGELVPYKNKNGEDRQMFTMYVNFPGSPFSFRMTFFRQDQIEKARSYTSTGKAKVKLVPDRNMAPTFELV